MITQVKDTDEGLHLLSAMRDLLNQCWDKRETIQTVRGARYMADYGANNPHCTCVAQAEWLARQQAQDHTHRRHRL